MGMHEALVYLGLAEEKEQAVRYAPETKEIRIDDNVAPRVEERPREVREPSRRTEVTPLKRDRARVPEPLDAAPQVSRISAIHPAAYNDAKTIGEAFRDGVPVIMNLTDMDDADAKRLVDFSAGLIFGLRGSIERVTAKVFLLTPAHVEVTNATAPAPKAAATAGFFNQS